MLTGLTSYCEINRGGLRSLQYIPIHQIDRDASREIISSAGVWQFALSFTSGDWLTMPYLPREDVWQEELDRNLQGESYAQTISGTIPGLRAAASRELQRMERMRFVVKLTDKNGRTWLIGNIWHGLAFRASKTSGDTNGLNSYAFEFQGAQLHSAPSYGF